VSLLLLTMPAQKVSGDPQVSTVQLDVPSLGTITGLCFDGSICQYLGIPYADVPGRFRRSVPAAEPWPEERWDGTKLGYGVLISYSIFDICEFPALIILEQAILPTTTTRHLPNRGATKALGRGARAG
jgi:hypothetical protein